VLGGHDRLCQGYGGGKILQKNGGRNATPWKEILFKVDESSKRLGQERKETFHTFVMKGMFE